MEPSDRSTFTAADFAEWEDSGRLILSPKFQRRSVWGIGNKAYFIDTLINKFPSPPIYLRNIYDTEHERTLREVVDGQQRIRAVLEFMSNQYAIPKSFKSPLAGKRYGDLNAEQRQAMRSYGMSVETFDGISDADVLRIFARLNTYSVALNKQELRNGRFFGAFKQAVYDLAYKYLGFWRVNRIFTERAIARMYEVELVSELLVLEIDGLQDKKKSLDDFYAEFDDEFPGESRYLSRFERVIEYIDKAVGKFLAQTPFRRPALFYSLFGAVFDYCYGMEGSPYVPPQRTVRLGEQELGAIANAVENLSATLVRATEEESIPRNVQRFVEASSRQTDNIKPRFTRHEAIFDAAFAGMQ